MQLAKLIEATKGKARLAAGRADVDVTAVVDDSRRAAAGTLFVARAGSQSDGRRFIDDAVARGAVAVLSDRPGSTPGNVAELVADDPMPAALAMAEHLHAHPARQLQLIGITGTNGKTTTAFLVRHLLTAAGRRCGLLGTIEVDTGRSRRPAALTTPGRLEMTQLLAEMVAGGCDAVVMEVSSHALDQGRVDGLGFDVGLFTNLSGDHLDYHQTMAAYAAAKARLMTMLPATGTAIVNLDDPAHTRMLEQCKATVLGFSVDGSTEAADLAEAGGRRCEARGVEGGPEGTRATFIGPWGELETTMPLTGRHNVANMLGALAIAHAVGLDVTRLGEAVAACPQVPGRLERVRAEGVEAGFEVIVDYAHTDDALDNVLRAVRPITPNKLRVLFGCGGDRDPAKRPRMAQRACEHADAVVVTSDNPRTEDPQQIIDHILAGVAEADRPRVEVEVDRRRAIERIIATAEAGDVVVIAGKGHEDYQIVGQRTLTFDDRQVAREALASQIIGASAGSSASSRGHA